MAWAKSKASGMAGGLLKKAKSMAGGMFGKAKSLVFGKAASMAIKMVVRFIPEKWRTIASVLLRRLMNFMKKDPATGNYKYTKLMTGKAGSFMQYMEGEF